MEPPAPSARSGRDLRGLGPPVGPTISEAPGPEDVRRRESFYRRALAAADGLAVVLALVFSFVIVGGQPWPWAGLLLVPLAVASSKLAGLYDRDELLMDKSTTLDEVPNLANLAALVTLLGALGGTQATEVELASGTLVAFWLSLLGLLTLLRSVARSFAVRLTPTERCMVAGDADSFALLHEKVADARHMNARVVGYVPLRDTIRQDDPEPLGRLADLQDIVSSHEIHRLIVAPRDPDSGPSLEAVLRAKALGIKVSVLPRIFEVVGSSVAFDEIAGVTVLGLRRFGLGHSSAFVKRAVDILGSSLGLVLLAPLLVVAAVAIKAETPGPVVFRQKRVGRKGAVFNMIKFRTMVADADAGKAELSALNETQGLFKISDDPRITRVGRWLRRSSLDEVLQLVNVLRGKMSLVGPRPLVLEEDRRVEGWHRRRLHIRPGLTGPWQILGSAHLPLYEMVKIDYLYVANWSLWGDVKILLRTILYVLGARNR